MPRIFLLGLLLSVLGASAASAQTMDKNQFQLYLHDLDRDTTRWIGVVSEVDVSSLKDLPYRKGRLMEQVLGTLRGDLSEIQKEIVDLKSDPTLTAQVELLMELEEAKSSMDDLTSDLDIQAPADMDKFSRWLNDATRSFGEINDASLKLYGHIHSLTQQIDARKECWK
jgi:hypothetical protein